MSMRKMNKGEWFELQCLFELLLHSRVRHLRSVDWRQVEWIERRDGKDHALRRYYPLNEESKIVIEQEGAATLKVELPDFDRRIAQIRTRIRKGKGRSFEVPEACALMKEMGIEYVKASSSNKDDMVIKFAKTAAAGYSVKAEGCSSPSLLNASNSTRFVFRAECNGGHFGKKGKSTFGALKAFWCDDVPCKEFRENMGTDIMRMMKEATQRYLSSPGKASVKRIVEELAAEERCAKTPAQWRRLIKDFLYMWAVEGTPSSALDGDNKASGGIIFLFPDGSIRALVFHDMDDMREYLYENTTFDSPDTGKHDWGHVYRKNGRCYIDYVLGIRYRSKTEGVAE